MITKMMAMALVASISTADLQREFPVPREDSKIVENAVSRWSKKQISPEKAMDDRIVIVFYVANMRCVMLKLRVPGVGPSPKYCYKKHEDVLIEVDEGAE
jgi:hypothetical protein